MFIKKDLRKIHEILEEAAQRAGDGSSTSTPLLKSLHLAKRKDEFVQGRVKCLTEPSSDAIREVLRRVESLSLYDCEVRDVAGLGEAFESLQDLSLGRNPIEDLPSDFGSLSDLRRLWLDDCRLQSLPPCVLELSRLQELRVSHNRLESLPSDFHRLLDLTVLCVDNNRLASLPGLLPPRLRILQVRENRLERLPPLPSTLRLLQASSNHISSVAEGEDSLVDLTHVYLNANCLAEVPEVFLTGRCRKLQRLNLCHNRISDLSGDFLLLHGSPDPTSPDGACRDNVVWLGSNPVVLSGAGTRGAAANESDEDDRMEAEPLEPATASENPVAMLLV
jgi:Leucine-rich repeat (LRR) protein